jgi:hypothetical protein
MQACGLFEPSEEADRGKVLARVKDNFLYQQDIEDLGLKNATASDSAKIVSEYIENWVRHQLMLEYAYKNLPQEKLNIEQQIQDYRESLIIYIYETEYLRQNMDTTITESEKRQFYEDNTDHFLLGNDLVRMVYLKLPATITPDDSLRLWMEQYDEESKYRIQQYAYTNALEYNLDDSLWFDRLSIGSNISEELAESYDLSRSQIIEVQDSSFIIFARISDFKIKESTAPFSYVEDQVERMIINKRKLRLKRNFSNNIVKNATEQNIFEIYK